MTTDVSSLTEEMRKVIAPLGPQEERRAIEAALEASGGARESLIVRGAELAIDKSGGRSERPRRRVRVLLSARAESVVWEVLVDVDGKVASTRELGPRNLPYLQAEVDQARAMAEKNEHVARRLAGFKVGVGTFAPILQGSERHRLVGLHFLDVSNANLPRPLTSAVVDLATGQLVDDSQHGHHHRGA